MGNINQNSAQNTVYDRWLNYVRKKHNNCIYSNIHPSSPIMACCLIRNKSNNSYSGVLIPDYNKYKCKKNKI